MKYETAGDDDPRCSPEGHWDLNQPLTGHEFLIPICLCGIEEGQTHTCAMHTQNNARTHILASTYMHKTFSPDLM